MASLRERTLALWQNVRQSAAVVPTRVAIPVDHIDKHLGLPFLANHHYFQVRLNEMFLSYSREWFSGYLPMAVFISEYLYDRERRIVPFVVGPGLVEQKGFQIPNQGMIFANTRVAGLHPYRGGRLAVTVILYRIRRTNYVRNLIRVLESAVGLLDVSMPFASYTTIGAVILDGIEALFAIGDTDPIIGWRQEFDPDAGDALSPGYFALINKPEAEVDASTLWVIEDQLCAGQSAETARPLRDSEYLLYSLLQANERSDLEALPFQPVWERIVTEASYPSEAHWQSAKANMVSLYQTISTSPDLTAPHAARLAEQYVERMKELHLRAAALGELELGPVRSPEVARLNGVRRRSVDLLGL